MTQPTVRVLQIDQDELTDFVNGILGSPVSSGATQLDGLTDVTIGSPRTAGEQLVFNGSAWTNTPATDAFTIGDGLDATAFAGSPHTIQVDTTVARTNATNTFQQANTFTAALVSNSSAAVVMNSAAPGIIFDESDAAADNQVWRIFAEGATLTFDVRNDAGSTTNNWLTVGRSGATVGDINLFGTALNFNGIPVIVGGSPYAGGGGGTLQTVTDSGNTTTNNLIIDKTGSPQTARFLALNNTAGASFDVTPAGALQINQTAAAGGDEKTWIAFARDGGVVLKFNNVNAISSISGGVQIDDSTYQFQKNAANTDSGGFGQWWVKSGSPNLPMFTDEGGTDHVLNDVTAAGDNVFSGMNTFTKTWNAPGDGPLLLESVSPIIEFRDTTVGDSAVIEFANTALRFGTLSQGSPNGPGYDGLLTVGHNAFSPSSGLSFFDFTGFSGSFTLTGGDFDLVTSGTINLSGNVDVGDNTFERPVIKDYAIQSAGSPILPTGTTQTFVYSNGPAFELDLESASGDMTVTLSGGPPIGTYGQMIIKARQDSATARTVTFTTTGMIVWTGSPAHPITTTLDGVTLYNFEIWAGSPTIWYAAGADYNN